MKHKRKKAFYKILAGIIVDGSPFDVSKNGGGYKTVQELINLYRLRELSDADKFNAWHDSLSEVKKRFDDAVTYINTNPDDLDEFRNVHIFKHRPRNRRNNQFLSVTVSYRGAKEKNTDRLLNRIEAVVRPAIKEIRETQPERLLEGQERTKKLLI